MSWGKDKVQEAIKTIKEEIRNISDEDLEELTTISITETERRETINYFGVNSIKDIIKIMEADSLALREFFYNPNISEEVTKEDRKYYISETGYKEISKKIDEDTGVYLCYSASNTWLIIDCYNEKVGKFYKVCYIKECDKLT